MRRFAWAVLALGLTACATTRPMQVVATLNENDPRFNSQACRDARMAAMGYRDNAVSRAGLGLAAGLLLGPFGVLATMPADMAAANQQNDLNEEIRRRCTTLPGQEATAVTADAATPATVAAPGSALPPPPPPASAVAP